MTTKNFDEWFYEDWLVCENKRKKDFNLEDLAAAFCAGWIKSEDKMKEVISKWICISEDANPSAQEVAYGIKKDLGLIKIGNVHTHPYPDEEFNEETLQHILTPSDEDIKYACKFRDLVRIIVVTNKDSVYGFRAHDMNRKKIDITLEELE